MRVAVIGAGAAGLNAARHVLAENFECIVFEQTNQIGGTWVYTDNVGVDEFGMPVHTSMYQGLKTNLPKEIMGFPDFPIPESDLSYVPQQDILKFLHLYCEKFDLRKHIQFYQHVKLVRPLPNERWEIITIDVRTKEKNIHEFDAVMVCNGHYFQPHIAKLNGIEHFKGQQKHSHDYRKPEDLENQRVCIIGAGPSGVDLALHIANSAKKIILSHHCPDPIDTKFPPHIVLKPEVKLVQEYGVIFEDDTSEDIDTIFYCTGYDYTFPFLSPECGIRVDDNYVQPLYKHVINIDHPTMALIGLPFYVCAFMMFDLQSRFFLKTLNGSLVLPSKDYMNQDRIVEMGMRWESRYSKRQAHMMGPEQSNYYDDVAYVAGLDPIPPVYTKLHNESSRRFLEDLIHFRNDVYKIVDQNEFMQLNYGS